MNHLDLAGRGSWIQTISDKKNIIKLAHLYFQSGQWDQALAEYQKILVSDPEDMNTQSTIGDILVKKNSFQAAFDAYQKAANGFLSHGHVDKAVPVYKKIVKLDQLNLSKDTRSQLNLIQLYVRAEDSLKSEKIEEAIDALGKMKKNNSNDPFLREKMVELDHLMAQLPVSLEQFQQIGEAFLKCEMYPQAQEMLKRILELDPANVNVRSQLAQVHLKLGFESDAQKEYLVIAQEALAKDNLDQALDYARKAIELKNQEAHYIAGQVYFKKDRWAEAQFEFEQFLRGHENHLGALIFLGRSLDSQKKREKAAEVFYNALKIDQNDFQAQDAWIEFCIKNKDTETAIPYMTVLLDKAVLDHDHQRAVQLGHAMARLDPELIFPRVKLLELHKNMGNLSDASDDCCALAWIYDKQQKYQMTIEYLEKAIELNPSNAEVLEKALKETRNKISLNAVVPVVLNPTAAQENLAETPLTAGNAQRGSSDILQFNTPQSMDFLKQSLGISPLGDNESPNLQKTPMEIYKTQMATADLCIKQGFLKAAIEIYQQLLDLKTGLLEIKKK